MEAGNLPSEMVSFGKCCWGQLLLGLLNSTIEVMVSKNNNKKSPFSTSASQHSWPIPDNNFQKGCGLLSLECLNMPLYEGMVGKFLQSGSILDTHRTYNLARGFIFLSLKWGGIPVVYAFTRSKGMNLLGSNQRGIIDYKIERNQ